MAINYIFEIAGSDFEKKVHAKDGELVTLPQELIDKIKEGWELQMINAPAGSKITTVPIEKVRGWLKDSK